MCELDRDNRSTMTKLINVLLIVAGTVSVLILIGTAGEQDRIEADRSAEVYCEMVRIHKENPEFGWPDFRGTYDEFCDN